MASRERDDQKDALDRWSESADKSGSDGKDSGEESGKDGEGEKKPSPFSKPWVKIAIAVVVIALVAGAIIWWLIARQYEDTDDAFIDTHIVHISPQTNGQVLRVYITDNQFVRAGAPLIEIDPSDASARIAQIEAQEIQAETQVAQATATEEGAAAQALNAARDLTRYRELQRTTPAAVAQQQIDQAVAAAANARAQ